MESTFTVKGLNYLLEKLSCLVVYKEFEDGSNLSSVYDLKLTKFGIKYLMTTRKKKQRREKES